LFRDFLDQFNALTLGQRVVHAVDVLIVAFIIYRLLLLVRGTRAWRILLGVGVFLIVLQLSEVMNLGTLHWILEKATLLGPVALVILFLPELRQAIEGLTKLGFIPQSFVEVGHEATLERRTIEEIVAAVGEMAQDHVGALIVLETGANLDEIANNGVQLNAKISSSLISSIFYGQNPLHDGAVILRGNTVLAAACRLPLSESSRLDKTLHMRHRAAVGVSEELDVLAIVVSEERGTISVARAGKLTRLASTVELREVLLQELVDSERETKEKKGTRNGKPANGKAWSRRGKDQEEVEAPATVPGVEGRP
jgi:diadenylate cyclase